MKKYFQIFKISWAKELHYRVNFFLGRLHNIIVLLLLFYVWKSLTLKSGYFAGYTELQLVTYVFGVNILKSIIFGSQSRAIAEEINSGEFSKYLTVPVNYFWFNFWKQSAQRLINFIFALFEVILFVFILKTSIYIQTDMKTLALFTVICFLSMLLYYILSYLASLVAFWSREALGPRFLFEWLLEFCSGVFFPLNILGQFIFSGLAFLPFFYLIYFPLRVYLKFYSYEQIFLGIFIQIIWILVAGKICHLFWKKGLIKYTGEGM
jgi:ABC-2 type transport system permease protein